MRGYRYIKLPPLNVRTRKTMESDISLRTLSLRNTIAVRVRFERIASDLTNSSFVAGQGIYILRSDQGRSGTDQLHERTVIAALLIE